MRGKSRNTRGSVMTNGTVGDVHCPGAVVENSGANVCVVITKSAVGNVHCSRAVIEDAPASTAETGGKVTVKRAVSDVDSSGAGIENTAPPSKGMVIRKRAINHVNDPGSIIGNPTTSHPSTVLTNDARGDVKCPCAVVGDIAPTAGGAVTESQT